MFALCVSDLSILQQVAQHCHLLYVSVIQERLHDDSYLYGIELELPLMLSRATSRRLFFWADSGIEPSAAYEAAALQALVFLQDRYGFVVLDYSFQGLILYRTLAQWLLHVANRGTQLARFVMSASHQSGQIGPDLLACAEQLVHELCVMPAAL